MTGLATDGIGVYNYYYGENNNAFTVTPAKAGLNTFMTGIGLYGGPIGWTVAGGYFLIDATIGWDNAFNNMDTITKQTRAVHGSSWNPYKTHGWQP